MERKGEVRVALEIRTSLRPERPGTTPEGNKKQRESRERRRERESRTQTRKRKRKGKGKSEPKQKREVEAPPTQERDPKSRSTTAPREERRGTRKKRWSQSSHTFRTDQWMALGSWVRSTGPEGNNETIGT